MWKASLFIKGGDVSPGKQAAELASLMKWLWLVEDSICHTYFALGAKSMQQQLADPKPRTSGPIGGLLAVRQSPEAFPTQPRTASVYTDQGGPARD